jgi:hypothetical protein
MTMPMIHRDFDGMKYKLAKLGSRRWKWIQATLTWPAEMHLPCFSILNQEEEWVKLNKCVVVKSKMMYEDKVLVGGWDMQDMVESEGSSGGGNNGGTNASYVHTSPICRMNLVGAGVGVMHYEVVDVAGDVVCHTEVHVPRMIGARRRGGCNNPLFGHIILLKTVPVVGRVTNFEAHLALWPRRATAGVPGVHVGGATTGGAATATATAATPI